MKTLIKQSLFTLFLVLSSFFFELTLCFYEIVPNMNTPTSSNIYQSGSTAYHDLVTQCDNLGLQCAGFNSQGWLKNSVDTLNNDVSSTIFVKQPGPSPPVQPLLWPLPRWFKNGLENLPISSPLVIKPNISSTILDKAIDRYQHLIFGDIDQERNSPDAIFDRTPVSLCTIGVFSSDQSLQMETDESYLLTVDNYSIAITSKTIYGAIRALETLSQLIVYDFDTATYKIENAPWTISDSPMFVHRGLLIDTSRHFLPPITVMRVIDSLSYAKMNVLHWHIVDAQSFPLESKKFTNLWKGSWTSVERYSQETLKDIVQYGKERGVRVMLEFDLPGHSWSWGVGYPDLLPEKYDESPYCFSNCPDNPCDVPIGSFR